MLIREATIAYRTLGETNTKAIDSPEGVKDYIKEYINTLDSFDPEAEHFIVIALNTKYYPKGASIISKGSVTSTVVHCREVFKYLCLQSATAFACVHNHPSGDPAPSRADIEVTRQIREAAKMMGIEFIDHVIIGEKDQDPQGLGFYSFNEGGMLY